MRDLCQRCLRPTAVCCCSLLSPVRTQTRVVFLQHPRERRVAIGTARLAHLGLPNSELHSGVAFDDSARLRALLAEPGTAVLFPGPGSTLPSDVAPPPRHLIVVDGTWWQAKKVLKVNPALGSLPRIGLAPEKPGNYRIRREPAAHCLSTLEAVVQVLAALEGDPARFQSLLQAFERMVDVQIAHELSRRGPSRHLRARRVRGEKQRRSLAVEPERLVLLHAEANAPSLKGDIHFEPELVHWTAIKPATGERFEAVCAPRQPLSEAIPHHLGLTREQLLGGEDVQSALTRWRAFLGEDAVVASWGRFSVWLLSLEGHAPRESLDLRLEYARIRNERPGALETVAARAGLAAAAEASPLGQGRAGVRLRCLVHVSSVLSATVTELLPPAYPAEPRRISHAGSP